MIKINNSNIVGVSLGGTQFSKIYKGIDLVWRKKKVSAVYYSVTFVVNGDYEYRVYIDDSTSYTTVSKTTRNTYKEGTKIRYTVITNSNYIKVTPSESTIPSLDNDMIIEPKVEYNLMEILSYNKQEGKIEITSPNQLQNNKEGFDPVGIIVVPQSHNVYGTNEYGVMALRYASYTDPSNGCSDGEAMALPYYNSSKLSEYKEINTYASRTDFTLKSSTNGYLPIITENSNIFNENAVECPTDKGHYYMDNKYQTSGNSSISPSPYGLDGGRNEEFYTTSITKYNCLSDLDGKANTDSWINEHSSGQPNWKTADVLENVHASGYSTSPWACRRYNTLGIGEGEWYLPSCGELAYAAVRMEMMANTIDFIKNLYPTNSYIELSLNSAIQSSTKFRYDQQRVVYVYAANGSEQTVATYTKDAFVIPFTRGSWSYSEGGGTITPEPEDTYYDVTIIFDSGINSVTIKSSSMNTTIKNSGEVIKVKEGDTITWSVTYKDGYTEGNNCSGSMTINKNTSISITSQVAEAPEEENVIYYTTSDNQPIDNSKFVTNANVVSNELVDGKFKVTFDDKVTSIGNNFLSDCITLSHIDLLSLSRVTSIGSSFLSTCSGLQSIDLSPLSQVTSIGGGFLAYSGLQRIDISPLSKVTSIGASFLYGCSGLQSIDLSPLSNVTSIGDGFLYGCSGLQRIDLSPLSQITEIGSAFLYGCSGLQRIDLTPLSKVTSIGGYFLYDCSSLQSIDLSPLSGITSIGMAFLHGCSSLQSIDLSPLSGITSIGSNFLSYCTNLKTFIIDVPNKVVSLPLEKSVITPNEIYVNDELIEQYKEAVPNFADLFKPLSQYNV